MLWLQLLLLLQLAKARFAGYPILDYPTKEYQVPNTDYRLPGLANRVPCTALARRGRRPFIVTCADLCCLPPIARLLLAAVAAADPLTPSPPTHTHIVASPSAQVFMLFLFEFLIFSPSPSTFKRQYHAVFAVFFLFLVGAATFDTLCGWA